MIEHCTGSIFEADVIALVCPVNCFGTMGSGLAKEFKREFPRNFERYYYECAAKRLRPGRVLITWEDLDGKFIVNFPTKDHWRDKSRIEWIESGLRSMVKQMNEQDIRSIAIPALGCGLGGLSWDDVRPMIEAAMEAVPDVRVLLYGPLT